MKNISCALIFISLLSICCRPLTGKTFPGKIQKHVYILIFDKIKENKRFLFKSGVTARSPELCEVSWIDSLGLMSSICLDPNKASDTIRIETDKTTLQVSHKIMGLDYFFYTLYPGDTLRLEYNSFGLPVAKGKSSLSKNQNLFLNFYSLYYGGEIDPEVFFRADWSRQIYFRWNEIKDNRQFSRLKLDYVNLDSIYELTEKNFKNKLSNLTEFVSSDEEYYFDIIKKLRYITYIESKSDKFNPHDSVFYANQSFDNSLMSDRIFFSSFYKNYFFSNQNENEVSDIFNKFITNRNDLSRFYLQLTLEEMAKDLTYDNLNKYFNSYLSYYNLKGDSSFIQKLKLEIGVSQTANRLVLKNINGIETDLNSITDIGNTIYYLDFWASWCSPCINAIPFSIKLKKRLSGENIKFIYLAFNDNEENWRRISTDLGINDPEYSFYIVNSKSAGFIRDIRVGDMMKIK